jgi:hypothetical protein
LVIENNPGQVTEYSGIGFECSRRVLYSVKIDKFNSGNTKKISDENY